MNISYQITENLLGAFMLMVAMPASADSRNANEIQEGKNIQVINKVIKKKGNKVSVQMDLNLDKVMLGSNKGLIYTPMIVSGEDTLKMPAVEVMGRKRYIYYQRNQQTATPNPLVVALRNNKEPQTIHYAYTVPYSNWMKNSQMLVAHDACGCNQTLLDEGILNSLGNALSTPEKLYHAYIEPKAEPIKARQENGSAKLNFHINKWDIVYDLGNNASELETIRKTLDLVKNDPDVTITSIILHGYASPDGRYANNEKLAHNRTQALSNYLLKTYPIDQKLFAITSTAEDWEGTRNFVENHDMPAKEQVLSIMNSNLSPDETEKAIASKAGEGFRYLVKNVWPGLRRTDYTIKYDVKAFNLEEARKVIKTRPQKLSLQEMYMVAQSYPKGSDEFNNVFDVAVRMFPEDQLANLNAAYAAIERGDKVSAEKYLKKAGNSAEADNARGCLAVMNEDYETAKTFFEKASAAGLKGAQSNLEKILPNL